MPDISFFHFAHGARWSNVMRLVWLSIAIAFFIATLITPMARAQVWDLQADWSDLANPNGAWSYRSGSVLVPHQAAHEPLCWNVSQPGWALTATGNNRMPVLYKNVAASLCESLVDLLPGDIGGHTDSGGSGNSGPAVFGWTSPICGTVAVVGSTWIGRDIGRAIDWSVKVQNVPVVWGTISSGDVYDRTNPMMFSMGFGSPGSLSAILVQVGDVVTFEANQGITSPHGDIFGVTFSVSAVSMQPVIVQDPDDVNGVYGGSATFSTAALGAGLTYQWRRNGVSILGAVAASLTLNNLSSFDVGNYDCIVTNSCGSVTSRSVALTVNDFVLVLERQNDGSLSISENFGEPGAECFAAFTIDPLNGTAPGQGPWHGLWIPFGILVDEFVQHVPPFFQVLDQFGSADFSFPAADLVSLTGTQVYGVAISWNPGTAALWSFSNVATINL